jgi:hypothetical protein
MFVKLKGKGESINALLPFYFMIGLIFANALMIGFLIIKLNRLWL